MAPSRLRVIVHGPTRLPRQLVADALRGEPDLHVVAEIASADDLALACAHHKPDVVVIEVHDSAEDGATVVRRHGAQAVGWCGEHAGGSCDDRFSVGAPATSLLQLAATVRMGASKAGKVAVLRPYMAGTPRQSGLSARELDVLQLITTGMTAAEVGARLGISAKTVNHHKQSIFGKLQVRSQGHAVAVAIRQGLLPPLGGQPARS